MTGDGEENGDRRSSSGNTYSAVLTSCQPLLSPKDDGSWGRERRERDRGESGGGEGGKRGGREGGRERERERERETETETETETERVL